MRARSAERILDKIPGSLPGAEEVRAHLMALHARKHSLNTIDHTALILRALFSSLAESGVQRPQDVQVDDLDAYRLLLVDRGLKVNTLNTYLLQVRKFFRFLEETQRIFDNPARAMLIPRVQRRIVYRVPTVKDIRKLLSQPDLSKSQGIRDRALLEVSYSTGCRLNELMQLQIFDPDLQNGYVRVTGKGNKERVAPLGRQAVFWLKQYFPAIRGKLLHGNPDRHALWIGSWGRPFSSQIWRRRLRHYAAQAGIAVPVTPHMLRRACATHMLQRGAHPAELQLLLGHATLQHLSHYLHLSIQDIKEQHARSKPGR